MPGEATATAVLLCAGWPLMWWHVQRQGWLWTKMMRETSVSPLLSFPGKWHNAYSMLVSDPEKQLKCCPSSFRICGLPFLCSYLWSFKIKEDNWNKMHTSLGQHEMRERDGGWGEKTREGGGRGGGRRRGGRRGTGRREGRGGGKKEKLSRMWHRCKDSSTDEERTQGLMKA